MAPFPTSMERIKLVLGRARRFSPRTLAAFFRNYLFLVGLLCIGLTFYIIHTRSGSKTPLFNDLTYVRAAYRVDDNTIRLVLVRSVHNSKNLTFEYGLKRGDVQLECHNEHCPDIFSPPCSLNGYIGVITDLDKHDYHSYVVIFADGNPEPLFVNVQDARAINKPKHTLGVCVQPIYLQTDYSSLVQFFEFWLSENASKFYIYRESYTKEVAQLLKFYQTVRGVSVEFINWSSLPINQAQLAQGDEGNPNRFWFRLEVFMSIFDCVHRSRGNVKYLAQTDLDEMIFVGKGRSIIKFMETMDKQEPEMAAVSFRSQRVQVTNSNWTSINDPHELSFSNLDKIILEDKVFKRPLYAKMIYRPERVFHVHIHRQLQTEKIPGTDRSYKHVNVAPEGGVVFHIRRLKDMYPWTKSHNSSVLAPKAEIMQRNYMRRLETYNFTLSEWHDYGTEVNTKIEVCRQKMNKNRNQACHNLWDCDKEVTSVEWVRSPNSWLVV